ncbi:nuclear receptor coactivator 7 isoform 2-T2 [Polymixia lowei]
MAQSVRRPETRAAMDHKLQRDKNRTSYFGNVKNRLGSKLPAGVTQPPEFTKGLWEMQPQAQAVKEASDKSQHNRQPATGRPLNHIPHIRNPKLRQYYLQGTSLELNNTTVQQEDKSGLPVDRTSSGGFPEDTVFSITSQFSVNSGSPGDKTKMNQDLSYSSSYSSSSTHIHQKLCVPKGKKASTTPGPSLPELDLDTDPKLTLQPQLEADPGSSATLPASPHSPSPDAEYDKLLDVEAVPMPDGQLCLLTLPPECSQGEGPEAMPYLKLFCRYITDCKGVVSGILLVTSNKIFFDPCKSHPLVMEHGCEEYLLSCSVDCLASVSFFSDITHVHFNSLQNRCKGKKSVHKSKSASSLQDIYSNHKGEVVPALGSGVSSALRSSLALSLSREVPEDEGAESRDMAETEKQLDGELAGQTAGALGAAVLSSAATFCCGGQDVGSKVKADTNETEKNSCVGNQTAVPRRLSSSSPGGLMFVRLRAQRSAGKKKGVGGLQLGTSRTVARRDAWLTLSQESSDELYAYLSHWRPDLCILEGGEGEGEGEGDEEEFVLIEEREDEEDEGEVLQRHRRSGEDWEIVSMEESGSKPTLVIDKDPECLTEIVEESRILEASHVRELCAELPARTIGHTWQLTYSTSRHGSSLKSLYRKLSGTDSPVLIVIKDALDQMFGSFLSHPLRLSETFYGTGETFLFMLHPRFKCFRWTGENTFFIKGDLDSFAVGGGSGHFGLWLDETLYLGRSSPCHTFNNCCLSETDDFRVMELEVWTFS